MCLCNLVLNFEYFRYMKHDSQISNNEGEQKILSICNQHSFIQLPYLSKGPCLIGIPFIPLLIFLFFDEAGLHVLDVQPEADFD
jgi:hypothetical protein